MPQRSPIVITPEMYAIAARRTGVQEPLLRAVLGQESGGGRWVTSPKGAQGPSQLMPGTAAGLEKKYGIDTKSALGNLLGGGYYLKEQLGRFKGSVPLALSAYNSGPGGSESSGRVENFGETQNYVRSIMAKLGGGGYTQAQGGVMPPAQAQAPVPQAPQATGGDLRQQVLLSLLAQRRSGSTDRSPVLAALAQMHQQPRTPGAPAHAVSGPARATQDAPGEGWQKWVGQPEHRSGPSAPHTQEILQFVGKVGQIAQTRLTPLGNESHSLTTVDGNRSAHADGMAADIPATGDELIRLGQDALIAAGMPPAKAREQTGGLFNVGSHQIIFNTHVGGDHTNHVHVGIRR